MSVGVLLRTEYIKTTKRFAFVVTMLFAVGVTLISAAANWHNSNKLFAKVNEYNYYLPNAWAKILADPAQMTVFFVAILIILLVAQEFPWRTSRQNVIDGMSRRQWFTSKVLTLAILCIVFEIIVLSLGFVFALPHTPEGAVWLRSSDLLGIGGYTLCLFGFAAMAFFLSMTIRNPGPALGVFLLWFGLVERIFTLIAVELTDGKLRKVLRYLPATNYQNMLESTFWNPESIERAEEVARTARAADVMPGINHELMIVFGFAYLILFIGISYVTYQKRDL